jgi:carbon storage regulator
MVDEEKATRKKSTISHGGFDMLVLRRKLGERIVVPNCDVTITIVAIEGNIVRLGVEAPESIPIHREEVWRRIRNQADPAPAE